jgi:hypothetical protein
VSGRFPLAAALPARRHVLQRALALAAVGMPGACGGGSDAAGAPSTTWGVPGGAGSFVGIDADRSDFAFSQVLDLSSNSNFGFTQPEEFPADYDSRQRGARTLPD